MKTLIKNGFIVDGTGKQGFMGEVLIDNDRIEAIGESIQMECDKEIDAKGRVVCPGFIDTHSHSDVQVLLHKVIKPKITQGITTEVLGQDGVSVSPLPEKYIEAWRKNIAGLDGDDSSLDWEYPTTKEYLEGIEKRGGVANFAYLVPHGNIRMEVMGISAEPANEEQLEQMERVLERELKAGAVGMSTGMIYIPCVYAQTEELVRLCKVLKKYEKPLVIHQRSEANSILNSMDELVHLAKESGAHIHISHFKIIGKTNQSMTDAVLKKLDDAKEMGITFTMDQYPYDAGSTMLAAIIPPWAHEGGTDRLIERLRDEDIRKKIMHDMYAENNEWENSFGFCGAENVIISSVVSEKNQFCVSKNLKELGEMLGKDPVEVAMDIIIEEKNNVGMIQRFGNEASMEKFMLRPEINLCTDGLLGGTPHPRVYGAYPRFLGKYIRDKGIMSLEEGIYKMSYKAALAMGIKDRGSLEIGKKADIVILDYEHIQDTATYQEPRQFSVGIETVLINGITVYDKGEFNENCRSGEVIRICNK